MIVAAQGLVDGLTALKNAPTTPVVEDDDIEVDVVTKSGVTKKFVLAPEEDAAPAA